MFYNKKYFITNSTDRETVLYITVFKLYSVFKYLNIQIFNSKV